MPDCVAEDHGVRSATFAQEPKAYSERNISQQQADAEKRQNITNATGHKGDHAVQGCREAIGSVQEASNIAWCFWWRRAAETCAEYLGVPN